MEDDTNGARRRQVEEHLTVLYGPHETQEKADHRNRVVAEDGEINQFQETGLRGAAIRKVQEDAAGPAANPPVTADPPPSLPEELAEDVPDPEPGYTDRVDVVAAIKGAIGIEGAVRRWGKPQPGLKVGNRTEGIHVRCPFPHHPDNNPSAWINTIKNTWYCAGPACTIGGDQIDWYAAAVHGLTPREFHTKDQFPPIVIEMAEELGIDPDPPVFASPPPPSPASPSDVTEVEPESAREGTLLSDLDDVQFQQAIEGESLDWDVRDHDPLRAPLGTPIYREWRALCPHRGTFWHEWLAYHEKHYGWIPIEYFLMAGAQLVGLACGHHRYAENGTETTSGQMMLAFVAPTSMGKSTAQRRVRLLLEDAGGARWDPDAGTGVNFLGTTPGSSEALLEAIRHEHESVPGDPSSSVESQVTMLWAAAELNSFVAKAKGPRGTSNNYRDTLIEFWDFKKRSTAPEGVAKSHSKTHGQLTVHDTFLSVLFSTQTGMVRRNFGQDDIDSGFLNRIVPVFGERLTTRSLENVQLPDPVYNECYKNLWERLRSLPLMSKLPLAREAIDYLKSDPYALALGEYGQREEWGIVARLNQHMHQIAFLLAVDEILPEVTLSCYERALHLTKNYLEPCYATFYGAAKATEEKDLENKIVDWLQRHYDRTERWPEWRALCRQPFFVNAAASVWEAARRSLYDSHKLARLKVTPDGGRGAGKATAVLTIRRPWTQFVGMWDRSIGEKVLYANT